MTFDRRALILFEGKTDRKYLDSFRHLETFRFLLLRGQYTPVQLNTSIYELYGPLIERREFDSLPVYLCHKGLLDCPEGTRPQDLFSLIYLVFDFDPLYHLYDSHKIRALRSYFSDETQKGLLYINFPMVESIFDVQRVGKEIQVTKERALSFCSSSSYKTKVRQETPLRSKSGHPLHFLPPKEFAQVAYASLARYQEITQTKGTEWTFSDTETLLEEEIKATERGVVYPLSCFPFMALDYNAQEAKKEWDSILLG